MSMFEVGKEYCLVYGSTNEQSDAKIKVIEIEGTWLHIESDHLDPMINLAAPMFISAREKVDLSTDSVYKPTPAPARMYLDDEPTV